jgi:hypothetical protein
LRTGTPRKVLVELPTPRHSSVLSHGSDTPSTIRGRARTFADWLASLAPSTVSLTESQPERPECRRPHPWMSIRLICNQPLPATSAAFAASSPSAGCVGCGRAREQLPKNAVGVQHQNRGIAQLVRAARDPKRLIQSRSPATLADSLNRPYLCALMPREYVMTAIRQLFGTMLIECQSALSTQLDLYNMLLQILLGQS